MGTAYTLVIEGAQQPLDRGSCVFRRDTLGAGHLIPRPSLDEETHFREQEKSFGLRHEHIYDKTAKRTEKIMYIQHCIDTEVTVNETSDLQISMIFR